MDRRYWGQVTESKYNLPGHMQERRRAFVNEVQMQMRPNEPIGQQVPAKLSGTIARELERDFRQRLRLPRRDDWSGYNPYDTYPALALAVNSLVFSSSI